MSSRSESTESVATIFGFSGTLRTVRATVARMNLTEQYCDLSSVSFWDIGNESGDVGQIQWFVSENFQFFLSNSFHIVGSTAHV